MAGNVQSLHRHHQELFHKQIAGLMLNSRNFEVDLERPGLITTGWLNSSGHRAIQNERTSMERNNVNDRNEARRIELARRLRTDQRSIMKKGIDMKSNVKMGV